jgi:iron complex outermembrane receptor protein
VLAIGAGNRESGGAVRYGGKLGSNGHVRVYGKYFDIDHTKTVDGNPRDDAWHKGQIGFRADWDDGRDQFSVQGNAYRGAEGQPAPGTISTGVPFTLGTIRVSGANLTARWDHRLQGGASLMLQAYYDRTKRIVPPTFSETLDIVDLQVQHTVQPMGMHSLAWGAGYRTSRDRVTNSPYVAFLPARENQDWPNVFVQDEISLSHALRLTLGARLEYNDYTGREFLPSARLAWKPAPDHLLWTAASRAVRAPSRLDHDTFVPGVPPYLLAGGPEVRSEIATVYEIGYRGQPTPKFSYSVTAFHADYDHLRSQEIDISGTFLFYANEMEGTAHGVEMWGTYQAARAWRLSAGLTLLDMDLQRKPGSTDPVGPRALGNDPAYQWNLRSSWDLMPTLELDILARRIGALPSPHTAAYTAVDARLGWRINRNAELSLTLQNLFDGGHTEYAQSTILGEFGRSAFLQLILRQ